MIAAILVLLFSIPYQFVESELYYDLLSSLKYTFEFIY